MTKILALVTLFCLTFGCSQKEGCVTSSDEKHEACVMYGGFYYFIAENDYYVTLDGKKIGKTYNFVWGGAFTFSPDSKHLAFVGERDGKEMVVKDGKEGKTYDGIPPYSKFHNHIIFSPDSKHVAYVGRRNQEYILVVDGVEKDKNRGIIFDVEFSDNSKEVIYKRWEEKN